MADFGLAYLSLHTHTVATQTVGTWQWLAPEMMEPGARYNFKVDVYAFGIVLWELLSGEIPYKREGFAHETQLLAHVKAGKRLPIDRTWDSGLVHLMELCWSHDSRSRPSMSEVIRILSESTHFPAKDKTSGVSISLRDLH